MALLKRAASCTLGAASCFVALRSMQSSSIVAQCKYTAQSFNPGPLAHQKDFDVVIVGAGIIGLATAREIIERYPQKTVCVVEKEGDVAAHQTSHNSGVIHAGMYYEPGSVMAKCCVEGARKIYEYCEARNLPCERCGKLIVAPTEADFHWVKLLKERGDANGVQDLEIVYSDRIQAMEPNVRGYAALYSPNTGIVDYAAVARSFAQDLVDSGRGTVKLKFEVTDFKLDSGRVVLAGVEPGQKGPVRKVTGKHVITCAGLHADRIAERAGGKKHPTVVPFRGTYWQMKPEYNDIVKMNIYPTPSGGGIPVGVHFTPTVNEQRGHGVIVGPGACLAFDREGYNFFDLSPSDMWSVVTNPGLWKFALSNLSLSLGEMYRDLNKKAFMDQARKLIPSVTDDMVEESFSGVMVQVFNDDGTAANDFLFEHKCLGGTTLHVRSAPTPACTSSMAIADFIVQTAAKDFSWDEAN
eukprot:TRINITY_DN4903_c0_g1_i1.p1 TRINITY_DN4903_c0_g1~~TRINITY_DN4903_c0_g1_i1.p1  ORF type:complete len:468 (+),score=98.17 TRINITY_DN4903_c0_g1_i1:79-1482(+)